MKFRLKDSTKNERQYSQSFSSDNARLIHINTVYCSTKPVMAAPSTETMKNINILMLLLVVIVRGNALCVGRIVSCCCLCRRFSYKNTIPCDMQHSR